MQDKYTVAVLQLALGDNIADNMRHAKDWVAKAAQQKAHVICLPELYRSQYFCQKEDVALFDMAEPVEGESYQMFSKLARELAVVIVVPIFERRAAGVYHNSALIINADGSLAGLYRKMHIPDDPAYYEKFYFAQGDLGFKAFDTAYARIATLICWDQWYPEAARLVALHGASTIFYPTAIGWHPYEKEQYGKAQRDAWMTVQRGHAIANGIYVATANRVGFEHVVAEQAGIEFFGSSFIADPQGVILAQASTDQEEIIMAEVDLKHMENIRRNWPFLRDRRIDAYGDITRRFAD